MNSELKQTSMGVIPKDWNVMSLEECTLKVTDGTHSTVKDSEDGEYFLLSCKNIKNGQIILGNKERKIDKNTLETLRKRTGLQKDDILLTTVGTIGESSIVHTDNINFELQRSVAIIRPNPEKIDKNYLYHFTKSHIFRTQTQNFARGSVQKCLFLGEINKIMILIPSIDEQKNIAQIFSAIDSKIELNNEINQTLKNIGNAIFKHWFVNFEFPNEKNLPYQSSNGEMVFNQELKKKIPRNWKVENYSKLAEVTTGKGLKQNEYVKNGKYPVFGANGELGRTNNFLFDEDLILTGRVGTLGSVYVVRDKVWISDNVLISKARLKENFYYLFYVINNFDFKSLNRGSTQPLVTQTDLKNQICLIPDNLTLNRFNELLSSIFNKIFSNNLQNDTLSQIRNLLLPKLLSGKIRIPIEVNS